jgi:hypothetical protein
LPRYEISGVYELGVGGKVVSTHLIGAGDDPGELALLLALTLHHGFDDTGMVGAQIDEAMGYPGIPKGLEEGK